MKSTKADVIFKGFWRVNEHFADLFNTVVFHGKEILKPEILEEMDTDVSGVIEMKDYKEIIYLIFDYPHKHYTFKRFKV